MWPHCYVVVEVVLSAVLNALACGQHATDVAALAWIAGGLIPVLVLMLGRVAGCPVQLYESRY